MEKYLSREKFVGFVKRATCFYTLKEIRQKTGMHAVCVLGVCPESKRAICTYGVGANGKEFHAHSVPGLTDSINNSVTWLKKHTRIALGGPLTPISRRRFYRSTLKSHYEKREKLKPLMIDLRMRV